MNYSKYERIFADLEKLEKVRFRAADCEFHQNDGMCARGITHYKMDTDEILGYSPYPCYIAKCVRINYGKLDQVAQDLMVPVETKPSLTQMDLDSFPCVKIKVEREGVHNEN